MLEMDNEIKLLKKELQENRKQSNEVCSLMMTRMTSLVGVSIGHGESFWPRGTAD